MAQINIRVDDELKKDFDDSLDILKVKQTNVFVELMKYVIQHQKVPFLMQTTVNTPEDIQEQLMKGLNTATASSCLIADIFNSDKIVESEIQHHKDIIWLFKKLIDSNLAYINTLPEPAKSDWKNISELAYHMVLIAERPTPSYFKIDSKNLSNGFVAFMEKMNKTYLLIDPIDPRAENFNPNEE